MIRQAALPGFEQGPPLTDRQAFALLVIREHGPLRSEELGAYLCERTGRHTHLDACDYDASNGRDVGEALHKKGLVRYERGQGWTTGQEAALPSSQMTELPEWF